MRAAARARLKVGFGQALGQDEGGKPRTGAKARAGIRLRVRVAPGRACVRCLKAQALDTGSLASSLTLWVVLDRLSLALGLRFNLIFSPKHPT